MFKKFKTYKDLHLFFELKLDIKGFIVTNISLLKLNG